jgi:Flagellar motor protein
MNTNNELYRPLEGEEGKSSEGVTWLITFADLVLLMLVFFILLFPFPPWTKSASPFFPLAAKRAYRERQNTSRIQDASEISASVIDTARLQRQIIEQQEKLFTEIRTYLTEAGKSDNIAATFDNGIITLRLPADVLFEPGEVELSPAAQDGLATVADILIKNKNQDVNIKGYTDDVEPTGGRFRDLWEISSLRAVNVLRHLMGMGIESSRLTATGLASMNPLYPNDTEENKARNRRIEFILELKVGNASGG